MHPTTEEEDLWPFYSIGKPNDRHVPRGQLPQRISDLLGRAQTHGKPTFADTASVLPDVPGLSIEGVGTVPVPLCQDIAEKLVKQGMGEQENVWMLFPHLIKMNNPAWAAGIQALAELSSKKLGINDAVLRPVLSKMMVVRAGGRLDKEQATSIGRSMATLVVTLPSEYVGGDWVVYDPETQRDHRYDLGKSSGNAAFKPQYVVYSAGSSYAMEEVTCGYSLMLVYSLCLPMGQPFTSRPHHRNLLRVELVETVRQLKGGPDDANAGTQGCDQPDNDEIMALMLSKTLALTEIEGAGVNSLSGVDQERFQLLLDANKWLPPAKRLVFYLARLGFGVPDFGFNSPSELKQAVSWYSVSGAKIDTASLHFINWTNALNFLNPGNERLSELWGNGGETSAKTLKRFALVGWPASADIAHTVNLIGPVASVPIILSHDFISEATLQFLLSGEGVGPTAFVLLLKVADRNVELLTLYRKLGAAIVDSGDVKLANTFVKSCVTHLKEREKVLFLPWVAALVERFDWENVRGATLTAIDVKTSETRVDRALELADILSHNSSAQADLTTFALEKTRSWSFFHADKFAASGKVITLLNYAMVYNSAKAFSSLSVLLKKINGSLLRPVIDTLSEHVNNSKSSEIRSTLALVAAKRRQWLTEEVEQSKAPFTWEIESVNFPDAAQIVCFLEGPAASFKICGFSGIGDARARAKMLRQNIKGALKFEADGRGHDAFVQILKAGGDFDIRRKEVSNYKAEIDCLGQLLSDLLPQDESTDSTNIDTSVVGKKRAREEEPDEVIVK